MFDLNELFEDELFDIDCPKCNENVQFPLTETFEKGTISLTCSTCGTEFSVDIDTHSLEQADDLQDTLDKLDEIIKK